MSVEMDVFERIFMQNHMITQMNRETYFMYVDHSCGNDWNLFWEYIQFVGTNKTEKTLFSWNLYDTRRQHKKKEKKNRNM